MAQNQPTRAMRPAKEAFETANCPSRMRGALPNTVTSPPSSRFAKSQKRLNRLSPKRSSPSLPGVFDPGDEFIGPPNRLVNILEHGQALCEGGVHLIPSLSLGNGRRPGLRPPVGEKPPAGGPRSRKVNLGSGVDQLEVDEIAGTIARVVPMPSSEKSFAASSLVCLSMRTVTLTVSMRTSPPRVCAIRRLYARQAVCSQNPSWRDGHPSRGDWNMPRPAPMHKDSTHDAVRHGCYLGCHARMLRVFPLFPLSGSVSAVPSFQLRPVFSVVSSRVSPGDTMSCFVGPGDKSWDNFKNYFQTQGLEFLSQGDTASSL